MFKKLKTNEYNPKYDLSPRQILVAVFCVILIIVGLYGANTLAFNTRYGVTNNEISVGNIHAVILNLDENDMPMNTMYGIVPGETVVNNVYGKSLCDYKQWMRIKTVKYCKDADGTLLDDSKMTLEDKTEDWTYNETDGYWYCKTIVNPHDKTPPLYTKVDFDKSINNDYRFATLYVDLILDTVQSDNNGDAVAQAQGWETSATATNK